MIFSIFRVVPIWPATRNAATPAGGKIAESRGKIFYLAREKIGRVH